MSKKLKRLTATTLLCSMVMSNMTNVYANKQAYIDAIKVSDSSPTTEGSTSYSINFGWDEPVSFEEDTETGVVDGATQHKISEMAPENAGYDVNFRNGTAEESYGSSNAIVVDKFEPTMTVNINQELEESSIYSFRAIPWHNHEYVTTDSSGLPVREVKRAPYESDGENREALYLTDIDLKAESEGNQIIFTWNNPTYMGFNVFSGYNIYYDVDGKDKDRYITVKVYEEDPNLEYNNGTFTYTATFDNIEYGRFYNAKIEPLVGSDYQELRNSAVSKQVTVDGETYPIGFTSRDYRYDGIYMTPSITLDDISDSNIQISWDEGDYSKIEIYSSLNEGTESSIDGYSLIGTLNGTNSSLTSFILEKPNVVTYYKVVFYFESDDGTSYMISDWVMYDPTYKPFEPFMPKIYVFEGEPELENPPLDVVFNAFTREAVTEDEKEEYGDEPFVDPNVEYKVWITDDQDNFYDANFDDKTVADLFGSELDPIDYVVPEDSTDSEAGQTVKAYSQSFSSYFAYENGDYVEKPTKDGKIYYIKIQAFRPQGDESQIAYDLTYVKPLTDSISNPITLTNPPLRLEVDDANVPIKTKESFNIEWQEIWNEAYDYETEQWYAVIGVDEDGNIVYGKEATDALNNSDRVIPLYDGEFFTGNLESDTNRVKNKLEQLGVDTSSGEFLNFTMRKSNLSDASYDIFVTSFANMESQGGYEEYFDNYLKDDETVWRSITPEYDGANYTYVVDQQDDPIGALEAGVSYVVYIRPYIYDDEGTKIYSYNPGYVVGETLSDRDPIPVIPPTIVVYPVDETQSSVTFEFEYSDVFEYDFRFSYLLSDYTEGGLEISNDELLENGTIYVNDEGNTMLKYTVTGLAPDTKYYTWGRAIVGEETSAWSLPLEQKTDELGVPEPPKSLGLMSQDNVDLVNATNGMNYENPSEDSFIIDFARVPEDDNVHENAIVENGDGAYIFEQTVERFPGAYFDELVPNQKYYLRAKTVVDVVIEDAYATYNYSYIVQISESNKFDEVMQVHVFDGEFEVDDETIFEVESEWSDTAIAKTGKTDDEYDGDKDDILYPIPDDNFEIIKTDDEIIYEYRGSGEDSEGVDNNLADQRLVSDFINSGAYSLVADLSDYDDDKKRSVREVRLPYRLVGTLNSAKINFTFKADGTYLTTSFSDIDKIAKANNVTDFGNDSMVSIRFENRTNEVRPYMASGGTFVTPAVRIAVSIESPTRTVNVKNMYDDLNIAFNVGDRMDYDINNVYVATFDDYGNQGTVPYSYDDETGTINVETKMLTTYCAVKEGRASTEVEPDYYYNVTSKLNITDLRPYNGSDPVYALYYNNIVAGIVRNKTEITMNQSLDDQDYTALGRSGLLISGDKVKREDAIASLVKLYEIKTGNSIKLEISTSDVPGISTVSSENKTAVAKAYQIGLYDDSNTNFNSILTFDEFFYMLDLILTDM